jgi:NADH-quinone oxidoreductase subunit K
MPNEIALLNNFLIVGTLLFGIGMIGFLTRRNMIVLFLSAEIMLQGISLSLVAWGRYHNDFSGQVLVLFIIAVAACEAAIALALIVTLYQRRGSLDIALWQTLREANQPALAEAPLPKEPTAESPLPPLPVAGVEPEQNLEEMKYRPKL